MSARAKKARRLTLKQTLRELDLVAGLGTCLLRDPFTDDRELLTVIRRLERLEIPESLRQPVGELVVKLFFEACRRCGESLDERFLRLGLE